MKSAWRKTMLQMWYENIPKKCSGIIMKTVKQGCEILKEGDVPKFNCIFYDFTTSIVPKFLNLFQQWAALDFS